MEELDLSSLRFELDKIDDSILELISKRFDVTMNIAIFKKENGLEIFQPKREEQLLKSKVELGNEFGLNEKFVERFFQIILDESKLKQKEFLELHQD